MSKDAKLNALIKRLTASNYKRKAKIRVKELKTGGASLSLDIYHKGERRYECLYLYLTGDPIRDDESIRKALMIRDKKEQELDSHEYGFITIWKAKSDFIEYHANIAKKKAQYWKRTNDLLREFHTKPIPFTALNRALLQSFADYLQSKLGQNTAKTAFTTIKTAINKALTEGIIATSPAVGIGIKSIDTTRSFLSEEELTALERTECQSPEVKRAFLFSCYTGLRRSDIRELRWEHIDADFIRIRQAKTNSNVAIPLTVKARNLIGDTGTGKVFDIPSNTWISETLSNWALSAGIDKRITFHSGRHTMAITGLKAGIPIEIIQKILGHSNIATTLKYAKIQSQMLLDAAAIMDRHFQDHDR